MDNNLSKENTLILDYVNSQLVLYVNTSSMDWLTNKIFFKTRLKHKVEKVVGNAIYFNTELVYVDYIKIQSLLEDKLQSSQYEFYATDRLKEYIEGRNIYIEKRARFGQELKTDATRQEERFLKFKNIVDSQFERKLRNKQMQDAFFMCAMLRSGNFSVPGSGKTSSALAVYSFLRFRDLVDRVVVIGPKNSFYSWMDEFKACFGEKLPLNCFSIQDSKYKNNADKRYALKLNSGNCNLFLFNYESLENFVDELRVLLSKRTLLVFDEVHKVKAIDGERAKAALEISKYANYVIAMTGTPIPNSYLDIYNLLHILYNDEYREFFGFEKNYLKNASPMDMELINKRIQPFFCRTTKKELQVPDANQDSIESVSVLEAEQNIFDILVNKYRKNKLALFARILQLESNPKLITQRLDLKEFEDIMDEDVALEDLDYKDYSDEVKEYIDAIDITSKKKACLKMVEQLVSEKKKVIVWCIFIDSITSIKEMLEDRGIRAEAIMGNVPLDERANIIKRFKSNEIDVLITNPHTLAESVSLHDVCHDAVYFEYSYNLVHLLQSKDRIHRLGLPDGQYTQYYYLQSVYDRNSGNKFSMDEEIYLRLKYKEEVMLRAIDCNELEPVYTSDEDLEIIFKKLF